MTPSQLGCVRLWQSVVIQALIDGSTSNPLKQHRIEARHFVHSSTFVAMCSQVNLNARALRAGMDDPQFYRRLKAILGGPERREEACDAA